MTQQAHPAQAIGAGSRLVSRDGQHIGTVKEVRGALFLVDAPMEKDYWLPLERAHLAPDGTAVLDMNHDAISDYKIGDPDAYHGRDAAGPA
jgi:hypothetical protein